MNEYDYGRYGRKWDFFAKEKRAHLPCAEAAGFGNEARRPAQKTPRGTFWMRTSRANRIRRERRRHMQEPAVENNANRARRIRRELAVLAGLLLALVLSNFTGFASACAEVRADTLRLHILANSDSEADQALKLAVRDAILAEAGELFADGQTKQQALAAARQSLPALQKIAQETLRAHGCADAVSVRLEELYFETREYEDFTLPAGRYDAVRIEIGAHTGKNWFCVLFPPLCLPAASEEDEETPSYSQAEQTAIHSPYRIRFAAVELLEEWKEALSQSAEPAQSTGSAQNTGSAQSTGSARKTG